MNLFSSKIIQPGEGVVVKSWGSAESYLSDPDDRITTYSYPCIETFESSSFGDGRIISNATPDSSTPFVYEYFLKDHLGSTRMVINDEGTPTEMVSYMPYGSMTDVGGASSAGLPVREKFTGKEFDTEGEDSVSGVGGIQAYYFGARYFDPEVGVWGATDPVDQYWNPYNYCGNDPVNYVDPNGEFGWFVWSIGKDGLQIGWQFPNGTGFYSNFGWSDGFSYSTGVTYGVNYSFGVNLSAGAQLGTTWHDNGNEWTQDASLNAGVGLGGREGGLGLGGSLSLSYSYNHKTWTPGWGTNLGLSSGGGSFGGSVGYGGDFQGNNGWTWGVNGQFVGDYSDFGIASSNYEEVEGLTMHRIEAWDADDGFGHYWIEADGEGYGYYPEGGGANKQQALTNKKCGEIAFGDDPHADPSAKAYYAKQTKNFKVYASKGNAASYYKDQLKSIPASHFGKQYGWPFGRNCHTFQYSYIDRNGLLLVRY